MNPNDRILTGVMLMIAFCVIAPLIDVSSKLAAVAVSVGVITLVRFVVQAACMGPLVVLLGLPLRLPPRALGLTVLRAVMVIVSSYCFVAAVRVMPIADALAIAFVEPFVILLIGRLAFGEQVGVRRLMACAAGFGGSLMVIQPSFAAFGAVALFPLGTAVTFALYILVTRRLAQLVHPVPMQFHTAVVSALICVPLLAIGHHLGEPSLAITPPRGIFWVWVLCVGLAATVSHMAMTYALKFAPSSTLAPLHYLEIVTATLFGYMVFGDFPGGLTWAGITVIVGSGLYVIFRERQLERQARIARLTPVAAPQSPL